MRGQSPQFSEHTRGDGRQEPPSGQLRREAEAETQQRSGQRSRRHQGKRRGCNKEKNEEGRMRKEGLEIQKPRGEEGKRRQRQRQARSGKGPSGGDWSAPPPLPRARRGSSHPLRSLTLAARGHGRSAWGAERWTQLGTPGAVARRGVGEGAGRRPVHGRGWRSSLFLFSSPLPALNGSVIDWPRVLFSPRAAGARGRLISIFPAAAPRSRSSCSRPPRRPRIYLWFNKKWELSQGLGLVKSSQHK